MFCKQSYVDTTISLCKEQLTRWKRQPACHNATTLILKQAFRDLTDERMRIKAKTLRMYSNWSITMSGERMTLETGHVQKKASNEWLFIIDPETQ